MLYTYDLNHLLTFPFKDKEARKNFLIGSLVMLAGFIIPFLPYFVLYGYISKIMRRVIDGEKARLPAWENFNDLLMGGLRLYGVLIVFSLPIMLLVFIVFGIYLGGLFIFFSQEAPHASANWFFSLILFFLCSMGVIFPIGLVLSFLSQPAGCHAVATRKFSAGFQFGEWWPILRKNLTGFALTIGMTYVLTFAVTIVFQVMYFTIILVCLVPFVMPVGMFYMILVMEIMSAQAYREGREKLAIAPTI